MVNIEKLTAVSQGQDDFLGYLTWFSVGKQLIKSGELRQRLLNSGLEEEWLPNPIRVTDAFRRATKEIEQRKETSQPNIFKNILVREVFSDKQAVQRNLVVETVDQSGKRLSYDSQAAVISLNKNNDSITFSSDSLIMKELCLKIEQKFNIYKEHYSAQQLRVMVNKILHSLAPTPVRKNGGIYFIPSIKSTNLTRLTQFIDSLDNSEGYKVPVIDSTDNRNMVSKKIYEHFDSILYDCRNKTNLTKGEVKALVDEANKVIKDYRNYKTIVSEETENIEQVIMNVRDEVSRLVADLQ